MKNLTKLLNDFGNEKQRVNSQSDIRKHENESKISIKYFHYAELKFLVVPGGIN
jgi:hypothetical protein